ncbi:AzlD domain-containing protein [Lactobacillus sp. DCY120]|uniref:AzlD domain-containing protein n=1 Tax=Bombilactobacillus apium TaxID=2675299 RepID=A0A850RCH2_9LACO|nr:AzlD domain-containing protein [Bombilactobacillus apium]NVY96468.1 AzlD domain-containing protein [Bombilactobacillus apium]
MAEFEYLALTIIGCALVTWLSRVVPFLLLKKFTLSPAMLEFLSFVPVTIMATLWFNSILIGHPGHLPAFDWLKLAASGPTVLSAILSKNLFVVVIVGVVSLALLRLCF